MWNVQGFGNKPSKCHRGFCKPAMWDTSVSTWQVSSLLTAGPETAVETFLHLKSFAGFGLFVTTLSQSLACHSIRMRSMEMFCFQCAVLLCCSTCATEATFVATLWDESGNFILYSPLKLYQFSDRLLSVASCHQQNWGDSSTFIFGGSIECEGCIYPAGVSSVLRKLSKQ